jgi:hypothetical protein
VPRAMSISDPDSLIWARELQAIAQTGLTFSCDPYDRERYEAVRGLADRMFAAGSDEPGERIAALFAGETGCATPKIGVRAAVFDRDARIFLVRETADGGRWTLPGGWADGNLTAAETPQGRPWRRAAFASCRESSPQPGTGRGRAIRPAFSPPTRFFSSANGSAARPQSAPRPRKLAGSAKRTSPRICRSAASCRSTSAACSPRADRPTDFD